MNEDTKKQLRIKIKKERADITKSEKEQLDTKIFENLIKSGILDNTKLVLAYMSTEIEVGTDMIIKYCLENSISVAIPRCVGLRKMKFYLYNGDITKLEKSKFGIYEPIEDDGKLITDFNNTVCIIPALSFDKSGWRLGYGGGFYDNFISEYENITKVGICYQCHIYESLPLGEYDKSVDFVITEENVEVCNG